jgi:hypothetical protein
MFGIGEYTVAPYKVVWKRMANDLVAAVISQCETPFGFKKVIPTDTTSLIAVSNRAEAHYLCAVLNSSPAREFVRSFSSGGRGFGAPSVMQHVGVPPFRETNKTHQRLAELSESLHEMKKGENKTGMQKQEGEVDKLVSKLFGVGS